MKTSNNPYLIEKEDIVSSVQSPLLTHKVLYRNDNPFSIAIPILPMIFRKSIFSTIGTVILTIALQTYIPKLFKIIFPPPAQGIFYGCIFHQDFKAGTENGEEIYLHVFDVYIDNRFETDRPITASFEIPSAKLLAFNIHPQPVEESLDNALLKLNQGTDNVNIEFENIAEDDMAKVTIVAETSGIEKPALSVNIPGGIRELSCE